MEGEERSLRDDLRALGKDAMIAQLHAEAPLFRDPDGFWVVSRFEDARAILLDHAHFSSAPMGGPRTLPGAARPAPGPSRSGLLPGFPLLSDDPPRHSVLRGLLAKAFTPASIEAMRPDIEKLAHELAERIPRGEQVDAVDAITSPLPVAVIAGMMGVPPSDHASFRRWSNAIVGIQDGPLAAERVQLLLELRAYFARVVAERRRSPGADLISALTRVSETDEVLNDDQVVGFAILLMIAGNETTTNLLGNLLDRLAERPEEWAALRRDPGRIEAAIEESLRADSPAQLITRLTTAEVTIGGATLPAGELVLVYLAAANRDPTRWSEAERFAIERERERHLAFGHGVHTCIGAPLARLEARAAMDALAARFTTLARGRTPGTRTLSGVLFGFRSLPLVFG